MPNDAMPDQDHFDILKHGVDTWNKWRSEHPDIRPNLGGADLTQASLHGIDLHDAYLPRITLRFADLIEANLNKALQLHFLIHP